jgi:hypothetical protein
MNKLILLLLLVSCAQLPQRTSIRKKQQYYVDKKIRCMVQFSKQGYSSQGIINICEAAFKKRD